MPSDPFAPLADLPGVREAATAALAAVDAVLWDRGVRSGGAALAAESAVRGARATAAVDGADVPLDVLRSGAALDGSPVGQVLAAALVLTGEVPALVPTWNRAPAQVLARLHALVARGFSPDEELGRPRAAGDPDDPLRIGPAPAAADVPVRLAALARLLAEPSAAPALVVAGVAHGELLALRPFGWGSGLLARAGVRLVLAARGVDPGLVTVPEAGVLALGRPAYVAGVRAYATGTPQGMARWLVWHCQAVAAGALETRAALAALESTRG